MTGHFDQRRNRFSLRLNSWNLRLRDGLASVLRGGPASHLCEGISWESDLVLLFPSLAHATRNDMARTDRPTSSASEGTNTHVVRSLTALPWQIRSPTRKRPHLRR